uniref:Carboxylic ester hydrolase n=1 Tax=Cacopsylla melanoneura TaxID=428564 RepID=A0A8D9BNT5_9HEMI
MWKLIARRSCVVRNFAFPDLDRNMSTKVVNVSYGSLKGLEKISKYDGTKYLSFQGIPYAKPPIGNLRFKAPQDLEPWEGIKDALEEGNRAPHYDMVSKNYTGDEDCLYLNVYVPQESTSPGSPLPVMVWFHGGGFAYGHADSDVYGPEFLMKKNVILVTVNYRLGILGFLNLETEDASGNMGLKDQTVSIKWVKKEIGHFGGDSNNITLFGESAGGSSVHFHMMSPLSKGLFHKSIIMSGSALCNWAFTKNHLQRAFDLGKLLGCETKDKDELLKFLHTVPPKTFAGTQDKVMSQEEHVTGTDQAFVPTVDGEFLLEEPWETLKKGNVYDVPTIVGTVSHEGFLMYNSIAKWSWFVDTLNKGLEVVSPYPLPRTSQVSEGIRKLYFQNDKTVDFTKHNEEFVQLYSHTLMLLPIVISMKYELNQTSRKSPLYFYRFSYDGNLGWFKKLLIGQRKLSIPKGVCHVDELGYLLSNDLVDHKAVATEEDKQIVDKLTTMWTNFAQTGNPNSVGSEQYHWNPVESFEEGNYLEIASPTSIQMKTHLDKDKMDFWLSKL